MKTQICGPCDKEIGARDQVSALKDERNNTSVIHALCGKDLEIAELKRQIMVGQKMQQLLAGVVAAGGGQVRVLYDDLRKAEKRGYAVKASTAPKLSIEDPPAVLVQFDGALVVGVPSIPNGGAKA